MKNSMRIKYTAVMAGDILFDYLIRKFFIGKFVSVFHEKKI